MHVVRMSRTPKFGSAVHNNGGSYQTDTRRLGLALDSMDSFNKSKCIVDIYVRSPIFFLIRCRASVGNIEVTDLVFVDNAVLPAGSLEVLVLTLLVLHEEGEAFGTEGPMGQTKVSSF